MRLPGFVNAGFSAWVETFRALDLARLRCFVVQHLGGEGCPEKGKEERISIAFLCRK